MPYITAQDLVDAKPKAYPTLEVANKHLDEVLHQALEHQQSFKGYNKPWAIVDFAKKLDPQQPWVGFEFETGFDSKKEYQNFINHLWAQDYTSIDAEGTGKYPVEVVYAPMHLADVLAGNSTLQKSVEFMRDSKLTPALNPTTATRRDVGIHAGISSAKQRASNGRGYIDSLCRILGSLNNAQMDELYGRHVLHWGTAHDRNKYIELKMFKAIPEVDRIKTYVAVVGRIIKLMDFLIDNPKVHGLANAYAYLSGEDEDPIPNKN